MNQNVIKAKLTWQDINWTDANTQVLKLQMEIVSAYKNKDFSKVKMVQEQPVRSLRIQRH